MTKNQIEYLKLRETQRSNLSNEQERARANRAAEQHNALYLGETKRANLERERQGVETLKEQQRYHDQTYFLGANQLAETERSNRAREVLTEAQLHETQRANLAREDEERRSNLAREMETSRANYARENLQLGSLEETIRSNRRKEDIQSSQLAEAIRFNTLTHDYRVSQLEEQHRANVANEIIGTANQVTNAGYLAERVRSDLAREAETALHNRAMELKDYSTRVTLSPNYVSTPALPSGSTDSGGKHEPMWFDAYAATGNGYRGFKYYKVGVDSNGKQITKEVSRQEYEAFKSASNKW